ncbi:MAG: QueT transporter family protein [Synergistaceae bacterium]|jgi:uncharacterized membrane protein|nr:QueT transporter family protein [Synergistaceae bacterium]
MYSRTVVITRGAMIGALYVVLVLSFQPFSYGPAQLRIAEALTILPCLWFEAIPGLFVGCLVANIFGGYGPIDIFLGSAATLAAAVLTYAAPNRLLAAAAPVAVNGIVVGVYLSVLTGASPLYSISGVAAGEAVACFGLGIPLAALLERARPSWIYGQK